jgi:hypothetical protein
MFGEMNSFAIQSEKESLQKTTGAIHKWAVDDISEVDNMNVNFASLFPKFKNMMRLMRYRF